MSERPSKYPRYADGWRKGEAFPPGISGDRVSFVLEHGQGWGFDEIKELGGSVGPWRAAYVCRVCAGDLDRPASDVCPCCGAVRTRGAISRTVARRSVALRVRFRPWWTFGGPTVFAVETFRATEQHDDSEEQIATERERPEEGDSVELPAQERVTGEPPPEISASVARQVRNDAVRRYERETAAEDERRGRRSADD